MAPYGSASNSSYLTCFGFMSRHSGGANFAMCDGSTRFVSESINLTTVTVNGSTYSLFQALGTVDGGENATLPP